VVFLNSPLTANRLNFNPKQRNSDLQDGVCQLLPRVPRRTLAHVRKSCTNLQGSHHIQRAINRDTLYQTSLLIGRYVAQKKYNESLFRAFFQRQYCCCQTEGKDSSFSKEGKRSNFGLRHCVEYIKILTWLRSLGEQTKGHNYSRHPSASMWFLLFHSLTLWAKLRILMYQNWPVIFEPFNQFS